MNKLNKRTCLTLSVSAACILLSVPDAMAKPVDQPQTFVMPSQLYGKEILFDVRRKGEKVGFHRVHFNGSGDALTVESDFQPQIKVLFVPVFRYAYRSESRWRDGQLEGLHVTLDDDGKRSALNAIRVGDMMRIDYGDGTYTTRAPLYPTNHWNVGVLMQDRVLNTLTGHLNAVRIRPMARKTVTTERGHTQATRYAYSGDLETEVWYDDAGRWVKMRFAGRDGSMIEYVCRRCQRGNSSQAVK